MNPHRNGALGIACVILSAIGFSAKSVIIKSIYAYAVDPVTLITLRMLFSLPFFAGLALWRHLRGGDAPLRPAQWRILLLTGFLGYYLAALLDMLGLQYIPASLERLLLFLYPTMVVALSALFLRRPVTGRQVVAMALSYAGILLVFLHAGGPALGRGSLVLGAGLVLASSLAYSVYLILSGEAVGRIGAVRYTAYASIIACGFTFGHFLATRPLAALQVPAPVYAMTLLMALVSTVLPTILMSEGLRRVGANRASLVSSVGPVITIGLGALFLGERLAPLQLAGAAIVLLGVTLVSLRPAAAAAPH